MDTLVLSTGYEPMARVPWQRAVTLLFAGKVEVVEEYEERHVRAIAFSIRLPSVIPVRGGGRRGRPAVKFSRENVYARDGGRCQYCGTAVARPDSTYDHVVP